MIKKIINRLRRKNYGVVPNPRSSDIYLVSYPKSGNTWVRYLLAYYIWPEIEEIDLYQMADFIPSVGLEHDNKRMLDPAAACNRQHSRIIKTHAQSHSAQAIQINKAVYLIRDGRDALVSYWHFCNQRDETNIPFKEFIRRSSQDPGYYGSWSEHAYGWINNPRCKNTMIVKYEDLKSNPINNLKNILMFCGYYDIVFDNIERAVEKASFNNMKKLEHDRGFNLDQLKNVTFVRQGESGKWKDIFDHEDLLLFEKYHEQFPLEIYHKKVFE